MTVYRMVLAALAAVVLVAVAPDASGKGGMPISSCGETVTTNAFLTQSIYCPGSTGIVVGASGITIDLKGFTLRGDRTIATSGIDNSGHFDKVTIKNGVVRNFYTGVMAIDADMFTVAKLLVSGNTTSGIIVSGLSAKIQSSTVLGNDTGILLSSFHGAVQSSTAIGNGIGMSVGNASVTVQSSTASGNTMDGMHVFGSFGKIQSSTASGNGGHGILAGGDALLVKGNRAEGNGYLGGTASDGVGLGITVTGFTTPPVGKNTARGNDAPVECDPTYLC